ncbi:MAG: hypothetical protein K6C12_00050 [Oscillospiraceae bacterium]|nr:hypothetical protein [Oscillospiraceae bacterium]
MAYCIKCGAYIPDGQTVCLACGYDPAAEPPKTEYSSGRRRSSAAQQYRPKETSAEALRQQLDEQRKRSQEQNRQWAEQEKQHREEQAAREAARREQQERDRQWAKEEYERRQAEQRARAYSAPGTDDTTRNSGSAAGEGNKALAALSYLSVLFALPYVFTPNDEYAKFHAKQGLKLFLFGIVADVITSFVGFGWIVTLARLYLIYKGMTNALNGKKEPLPYIGTIGDS